MPEQMKQEWYKNRVGIFLRPRTRDKLNVLKASLFLQTGKPHSQDDVVNLLMDQYAQATAAKSSQARTESFTA